MSAENSKSVYQLKKSPQEYAAEAESITSPSLTIGIVGGMGPEATGDLFRTIVNLTGEYIDINGDQDHLPIVVGNLPQTPDRTARIFFETGESGDYVPDPFPYLLKNSLHVISADAKIIGIPCNTAHYFVPALKDVLSELGHDVEIVHMIAETAKELKRKGVEVAGLLATTGTIQTKLYERALTQLGIEVVIPESDDQMNLVMDGIYGNVTQKGVKRGFVEEPREKFISAAEKLRDMGAKIVIEGCTEIPIALRQSDTDIPLINPTEILARRMIERAIPKS